MTWPELLQRALDAAPEVLATAAITIGGLKARARRRLQREIDAGIATAMAPMLRRLEDLTNAVSILVGRRPDPGSQLRDTLYQGAGSPDPDPTPPARPLGRRK